MLVAKTEATMSKDFYWRDCGTPVKKGHSHPDSRRWGDGSHNIEMY